MLDGETPYGPFVFGAAGSLIPALDRALPGMCLGERRRVVVPPRLGWPRNQHDTITVLVDLVWRNGYQVHMTQQDF